MSIASTTSRVAYVITSLPATLTVTFPFNTSADLIVIDGGASNTGRDPAATLTLASDYTVTGGGYNGANQLQTGSVVVVSTGTHAVVVGDVITILRNISPVQSTTFASTGLQTPLMIEADDDKLTALTQEVLDTLNLCFRAPRNENVNWQMPAVASRLSSIAYFDSAGALTVVPLSTFLALLVSGVVTSIAGTAGEITASASTGAVVLSLPAGLVFTGKTVTGGTFTSPTITVPTISTTTPILSTLADTYVNGSAFSFTHLGTEYALIGGAKAVFGGSEVVTDLGIAQGTFADKVRIGKTAGGTPAVSIDQNGGNGAWGATTPSTGAFTTLSATGDTTLSGTSGTAGHGYIIGPTAAGKGVTIKYNNATGFINFRDESFNQIALITATGINTTPIGATTPSTGAFTTLSATGAFGVNGAGAVAKPTVTGSRGGNAALASFLTAIASYGLITDSSSI